MPGLVLSSDGIRAPRRSVPQSVCDRFLSQIQEGHLTMTDPQGFILHYGLPGSELAAHMIIHNVDFYRRVCTHGTLGFGESYMEGWWDCADGELMECVAIFLLNKLHQRAHINPFLKLWILGQRSFTRASRAFSRRCVAHHYDAGNHLYEHFLDESLTYSCGYQRSPGDTIEQMQAQKHELICRKLNLAPGQHIVDLGCGFAGMLIHAAKHYGVTGLGVTLSKAQYARANEFVAAQGLGDRITIELKDYRDVVGTFDRVVTIGMMEHVYHEGYEYFLQQVAALLEPGGIALLHTICSTDPLEHHCDPWFNKHIFPGGHNPRLEELAKAAREADLTVAHVENLKPHYAETLRHWHRKFRRNRQAIRKLGRYDEVFIRKWDYYLQAGEATFRYGKLQLNQLLCFKGDRWTLPMRLEY